MHPVRFREDSGAVQLFIHYLNELPLGEWTRAASKRPWVPRIAEAEAALILAVRDYPDHQAVFDAKAAVLDALQRFECPDGRRITRSRQATEHLRETTEHAALAVLVRRYLATDQFKTLYAPFESAIPTTLLLGLGRPGHRTTEDRPDA